LSRYQVSPWGSSAGHSLWNAWGESLVTPPSKQAVTLSFVKRYLRIDGNESDDELDAIIEAAIERAQMTTRRQLITATRRVTLRQWPAGLVIHLPYSPLQSVTSIKYDDDSGSEQTWDSSNYVVDATTEPGRIKLKYDQAWPIVDDEVANIRVDYVCGYGDSPSDVPYQLRVAIALSCAHMYDFRSEYARGSAITKIPETAQDIYRRYVVGDEWVNYAGR